MGERPVTLRVPRSIAGEARRRLAELLVSKGSLSREEYLFLLELEGFDTGLLVSVEPRGDDGEMHRRVRERGRERAAHP